ncbi:hypothetical protein S7335_209 [Synechococcus sp. PCC 7335]|uniref:hypothetical protein n=1 Tax=Synechococcus sp. (strain ATCC 29403 / PCC 7335) TaxID=91464 RepID=UPI00017ED660|nr:hypothetical protein [Synechococcus sp. PCC 7335]EDX83031.1 hypothetical protein S7335_209 [Synechococcus sp. PCC 7335]
MNAAAVKSALLPESPSDHALFKPESGLWVTLRNAPSDYSHHEALLLCETFSGEWVSWVPGFGEITLSRGQFHQGEQV